MSVCCCYKVTCRAIAWMKSCTHCKMSFDPHRPPRFRAGAGWHPDSEIVDTKHRLNDRESTISGLHLFKCSSPKGTISISIIVSTEGGCPVWLGCSPPTTLSTSDQRHGRCAQNWNYEAPGAGKRMWCRFANKPKLSLNSTQAVSRETGDYDTWKCGSFGREGLSHQSEGTTSPLCYIVNWSNERSWALCVQMKKMCSKPDCIYLLGASWINSHYCACT